MEVFDVSALDLHGRDVQEVLSDLAVAIRGFSACALALVASCTLRDVSLKFVKAMFRWRRRVINLTQNPRVGVNRLLDGFKAMSVWIQWKKMHSSSNPRPPSLPKFWWGGEDPTAGGGRLPVPKGLAACPELSPVRDAFLVPLDVDLTREQSWRLGQLLMFARGLPAGNAEKVKGAMSAHAEMLHNRAAGPWEDHLEEVEERAFKLAERHASAFKVEQSHLSLTFSAELDRTIREGGKAYQFKDTWVESLRHTFDFTPLRGKSLRTITNQKVYIPLTAARWPIARVFFTEGYEDPRVTLGSVLGGECVLTLDLAALTRKGHVELGGSVLAGLPLWEEGDLSSSSAVAGEVPLTARAHPLPENGWKIRIITIPEGSYSRTQQAARHWFQDNLERADLRVGIGFKAANKLWAMLKGGNKALRSLPSLFTERESLSADTSSCTDSSSLRSCRAVLAGYLAGLESKGVSVPPLITLGANLMCSPHRFLYKNPDTGELEASEGEHQTGVMMGEELSFIIMTLQNLILDDIITEAETEEHELVEDLTVAGLLSAIIGDDYVRLFCKEPRLYQESAFRLFSWKMSLGKHGVSRTNLQLAEESAWKPREGKTYTKEDVVKIKYLVPPAMGDTGDVPAWVGRGSALSQALSYQNLDWGGPRWPQPLQALSVAMFCNSNHLPKEIPLAASLPITMGGVNFPTSYSMATVLRRTGMDMLFAPVMGLGDADLRKTLGTFAAMHSLRGTGKGVAPPVRNLESYFEVGDIREEFQPRSEYPCTLWGLRKWLALQPETPELHKVTVGGALVSSDILTDEFLAESEWVKASALEANEERKATLTDIFLMEEPPVRGGYYPKLASIPAKISRVLHSVHRKVGRVRKDMTSWRDMCRKAYSLGDLGRRLAIMAPDLVVRKDSLFAGLYASTFPWTLRFKG
jgi:hypothetical protein